MRTRRRRKRWMMTTRMRRTRTKKRRGLRMGEVEEGEKGARMSRR